MTRLLAPEMFGIMAIASVVPGTLLMLADVGLRQNIVRSHRGEDPVFLDTAWVVQIIRGVTAWFITLGLSVALHFAIVWEAFPPNSVYASPVLPFVIAVSSLTAIIAGFQSTKWALAFRRFDQKRIAQIELTAQIIALPFMFVIGVVTHSIWALVSGGLVASLTTTILSHTWMSGNPNRLRWDKDAFRELIDFGRWIFVSSAVGVIAGSSSSLMLGAMLDAEELGLFVIAGLILGAITGGFGRIVGQIGLPAFSEIARKDPSKLREAYYKIRVPIDLFLLFLAGLLFASGQLVIDLLYDPRYAGAGTILQILALGLFAVRFGPAKEVYLALGMPRFSALLNVVGFVSIFTVVPITYFLAGKQGAIWGMALCGLAGVFLILVINAGLRLNDYRRELMVLVALPAGFLCGSLLNLLHI
jgi:O-antigen/teichoic acid export membrane protein